MVHRSGRNTIMMQTGIRQDHPQECVAKPETIPTSEQIASRQTPARKSRMVCVAIKHRCTERSEDNPEKRETGADILQDWTLPETKQKRTPGPNTSTRRQRVERNNRSKRNLQATGTTRDHRNEQRRRNPLHSSTSRHDNSPVDTLPRERRNPRGHIPPPNALHARNQSTIQCADLQRQHTAPKD